MYFRCIVRSTGECDPESDLKATRESKHGARPSCSRGGAAALAAATAELDGGGDPLAQEDDPPPPGLIPDPLRALQPEGSAGGSCAHRQLNSATSIGPRVRPISTPDLGPAALDISVTRRFERSRAGAMTMPAADAFASGRFEQASQRAHEEDRCDLCTHTCISISACTRKRRLS